MLNVQSSMPVHVVLTCCVGLALCQHDYVTILRTRAGEVTIKG